MFRSLSLRVWLLVAVALLAALFHYKSWENRVIEWDVTSYYMFLPAVAYHGDLSFSFVTDEQQNNHQYFVTEDSLGNRYGKMTAGLAVLYSPWFALGHFLAGSLDQPQDGFSDAYEFALLLGAWFYCVMGLFLLRGTLRNLGFNEYSTALTLLGVALGTNLPYYTAIEGGMSHVYNFFLASALLRTFVSWQDKALPLQALLIGLLLGLMAWIRPINALFALPFLVLLFSGRTKSRGVDLILHLLIVALAGALAIFPQLALWHFQTGDFIVYSYGEEGFFWNNPHIVDGLLSYRKGWLLYTPLGALMLTGCIPLYRHNRSWFWALLLFVPVFFYVTFSWWCWWYGGGFSARTLIDALPLLSIPLAALVDWSRENLIRAIPTMFLVLVFTAFGLFKNWQYYHKLIHWDGMTQETYWEVFLKRHHTEGLWDKYTSPDYDRALRGEE